MDVERERDEYDAVVGEAMMEVYNHAGDAGGGSSSGIGGRGGASATQLGYCETYLREMQSGALHASLASIQDILVRNDTLIASMDAMETQWGHNNRGERTKEFLETRSMYNMELRNNMIELARLTAEVPRLTPKLTDTDSL